MLTEVDNGAVDLLLKLHSPSGSLDLPMLCMAGRNRAAKISVNCPQIGGASSHSPRNTLHRRGRFFAQRAVKHAAHLLIEEQLPFRKARDQSRTELGEPIPQYRYWPAQAARYYISGIVGGGFSFSAAANAARSPSARRSLNRAFLIASARLSSGKRR